TRRQEEQRRTKQRADGLEVESEHLDGEAGVAKPQERAAAAPEAEPDAGEDKRERDERKEDQVVERGIFDELQSEKARKRDCHAVGDRPRSPDPPAPEDHRAGHPGRGDDETYGHDQAMAM